MNIKTRIALGVALVLVPACDIDVSVPNPDAEDSAADSGTGGVPPGPGTSAGTSDETSSPAPMEPVTTSGGIPMVPGTPADACQDYCAQTLECTAEFDSSSACLESCYAVRAEEPACGSSFDLLSMCLGELTCSQGEAFVEALDSWVAGYDPGPFPCQDEFVGLAQCYDSVDPGGPDTGDDPDDGTDDGYGTYGGYGSSGYSEDPEPPGFR